MSNRRSETIIIDNELYLTIPCCIYRLCAHFIFIPYLNIQQNEGQLSEIDSKRKSLHKSIFPSGLRE